jgi:hypothetical protein
MAELTPLQIIRNMARNVVSRRPAGSGVGAMGEINSLGQSVGGKDPRLDNFSASLDPYQLDLGGEISEDLTGYRIPVVSDLGSAVNAYLHGIKMNEYRNEIREELDAQLESVGIKKGTSEYWKEYTKRMPDVGSPEAMVEFGVGAAIGAPVVKGSFGALKALYNMIPKEQKAQKPYQRKSESVVTQAEIGAENLNEL